MIEESVCSLNVCSNGIADKVSNFPHILKIIIILLILTIKQEKLSLLATLNIKTSLGIPLFNVFIG